MMLLRLTLLHAHMTMYCGRWSAFVTTLVSPPLTSGCSRVRATAAPISKSATSAWPQHTDLLVDVTLRHNFIGAGQIGQNQGQLRNPDNPDHILKSAAADKIRNYRDTYHRNRHVAFLLACMSASGRIHGKLLRLIRFLSIKMADDYFAALGYQPHQQEFVTVAAFSSSKIGTKSGCHVLRLWLCVVAAPRDPPPLHMAYDEHDRNVRHINGFA